MKTDVERWGGVTIHLNEITNRNVNCTSWRKQTYNELMSSFSDAHSFFNRTENESQKEKATV